MPWSWKSMRIVEQIIETCVNRETINDKVVNISVIFMNIGRKGRQFNVKQSGSINSSAQTHSRTSIQTYSLAYAHAYIHKYLHTDKDMK